MKNLAVVVPNKRVHVTVVVHVDERRCGDKSDFLSADTVERIVRSRLLDKDGIRDVAGVFEMKNLAVDVPNKRVHVTVAVHVDERRYGVPSDVDTVERIVRLLDKRGIRDAAGVFEMKNLAVVVPNKRVHVTVVVHVDERRCGDKSDFLSADTVERIVRSRLLDKDGIRDVAGVFEMKNLAVDVPNKRVHVTVAVHVDERRCGPTSDVDIVERIVRLLDKGGIIFQCYLQRPNCRVTTL